MKFLLRGSKAIKALLKIAGICLFSQFVGCTVIGAGAGAGISIISNDYYMRSVPLEKMHESARTNKRCEAYENDGSIDIGSCTFCFDGTSGNGMQESKINRTQDISCSVKIVKDDTTVVIINKKDLDSLKTKTLRPRGTLIGLILGSAIDLSILTFAYLLAGALENL